MTDTPIRPDMTDAELARAMREHPEKMTFPGALLMSYGPSGYTGAAFAIKGTMYFADAYTAEVRQAIAVCFEAYQAVAGEHLTWLIRGEPPKGPAQQPYAKAPSLRAMLEAMDPDDAVSFTYTSGKTVRDAGFHLFDVQGRRAWQVKKKRYGLDRLTFALPVPDVLDHPTRFQGLFLEFFNTLRAAT